MKSMGPKTRQMREVGESQTWLPDDIKTSNTIKLKQISTSKLNGGKWCGKWCLKSTTTKLSFEVIYGHRSVFDCRPYPIKEFCCRVFHAVKMFRNQYDTDVTVWSPQGRLHQVEYAMEVVNQVGLHSRFARPGIWIASSLRCCWCSHAMTSLNCIITPVASILIVFLLHSFS